MEILWPPTGKTQTFANGPLTTYYHAKEPDIVLNPAAQDTIPLPPPVADMADAVMFGDSELITATLR